MGRIQIEDIIIANQTLKDVVHHTPLQRNQVLSERYEANIYLKREDLQVVRSFKIRGAFHLMHSLPKEKLENGVVCASAGNHAQGVAYSCQELKVHGKIFMPTTTPRQKVDQVKLFGKDYIEVIITGDTFDDAYNEAMECCEEEGRTFIHPFNHEKIIAGQGTVGMEIMNDIEERIDYLFSSIGGGGLVSGVGTYVKSISPSTKIIGTEPLGAPGMRESLEKQEVVELDEIEKFVDGAAVKKVGDVTYDICRNVLDDIVLVPEGKICTTILELYNQNAIVAEPAGAMPISALDFYQDEIKGKTVVCVISGGNNDIGRMEEMRERSMIYEGLQHYFIITFPQRAGALREFLDEVLGLDDDITRFEYNKKNNKSVGPALVGIETHSNESYQQLIQNMKDKGFHYEEITKDKSMFNFLI
ncbi:L-threonine ammonia-lyase [Salsuginibacillus halophilus]|uniref:L-threonine dehydratase n=1 Tax=Salsuginibacillus halophilus TaxID=517424 RepID=A0A2P8HWE3_9BACI|nr:threonine ammonia-lyase IlvA [Salsuginibacillus halophilus]PSL50550.1 L-threonine ammonia-lyase [Salsuginibacillus halophilus]